MLHTKGGGLYFASKPLTTSALKILNMLNTDIPLI